MHPLLKIKQKKDVFLIILGRLLTVFASFVLIRLGTEVLTPDEMGGVTQLLGLAGMIYLLFFLPLWQYFTRHFLEWNASKTLFIYIKYLVRYLIFAVIVVGLLVYLLQDMFNIIQNIETFWVVLLVMMNFLFQALSKITTDGLNILGYRLKFVILSNLIAWLSVALAYYFYKQYETVSSWVLGIFLSYVLVSSTLVLLLKNIADGRRHINLSEVIRINYESVLNLSVPIIFMTFFWWVSSQGYKFIIQDLSIVGLFAIGYSLAAAPIALFESIFSQYYDPIFFKNLKRSNKKEQVKAWNKYAKLYLPAVIVMGIFVASNAFYLTQLLVGEDFRESAGKVIVWGVAIEIVRSIIGVSYQVGIAKVDMKFIFMPYLMGAIISLVAVYYFDKLDGLDGLSGISLGMLMGVLVSAVMAYNKSIKELPIEWPFSAIGKAMILSIPMIIFSYFEIGVENSNFLFNVINLTVSTVFLLFIQWYLFIKAEL